MFSEQKNDDDIDESTSIFDDNQDKFPTDSFDKSDNKTMDETMKDSSSLIHFQRQKEFFHKVGFGNDVIVVHSADGEYFSTDWQLLFERKVNFGIGSKVYDTFNASVHLVLNGQFISSVYLRIREDGMCVFPDGSSKPPKGVLEAMMLLPGVNNLRFEVRFRNVPHVLVGECFLFLYHSSSRFVVVDIDGTITRSDVLGLFYSMGANSGYSNHVQPGICAFLNSIVEEGANILYLTSRPVSLANKTRSYLLSLRQDGFLLPIGPLISCYENIAGVLFRELFAKDMHQFKGWALKCLSEVFQQAGSGSKIFAAGIGNRATDAIAYQEAGIPLDYICIIDTSARIQTWNASYGLRNLDADRSMSLYDEGHAHFYVSYGDPRFLSLLKRSLEEDNPNKQKVWHEATFESHVHGSVEKLN